MREITKLFPYLREEAELLRARAVKLEDEMYDTKITASLSGMPHSGGKSDPTAMAGTRDRGKLTREIADLRRRATELEDLHLNILATLRILTDAERHAVWHRDISPRRLKWAELAREADIKRSVRWWQLQYRQGLARFENLEVPEPLTEDVVMPDGWKYTAT